MTDQEKNKAVCDVLGWDPKWDFEVGVVNPIWPDPYHDVALAVRALEEWCKKKNVIALHYFFSEKQEHYIHLTDDKYAKRNSTLPAAICDAILANEGIQV